MKTKPLPLKHALSVKSAEFWLVLGQPAAAGLELQKPPSRVMNHPWVQRVFQSAAAAYLGLVRK